MPSVGPRSRDARKRGWPANLYERNGYFSWRNPMTGKEHGIGRDKRAAIIQAVEANVHVAGLAGQARLVDKLTGDADRSFGAWLDRYEEQLKERDLAANTRKSYKSLVKLCRELFDPTVPIGRVRTLEVAQALGSIKERGNKRTAQALRSRLTDIFRAAQAEGWIGDNPALITEKVKVKVKRARLPFEVFLQLYQSTTVGWLRNAMALALVTGQRREDVALATFKDVHDDAWWCEQVKTKTRVCIPLALRLECFGMSLEDVVRQCRATGVVSRHLVHQVRPHGNSPVGRRIFKDTISRNFTDELAKLKLDWGDREPPTFHEIRSLSERLYDKQGNVKTQDLLGHKDPRSTALYHDARGSEWIRVKVGL